MKIDLGQTLSIVANIGVIAGILLLVYELNQNRDMMRAQIRNEIATSLGGALPAAFDAELAEALYRSDNGEELMGGEGYRESLANEILFRYWENAHYQYRQGLYDDDEFEGHRVSIVGSISLRPRLTRFWCRNRDGYSRPFVEFIESALPSGTC